MGKLFYSGCWDNLFSILHIEIDDVVTACPFWENGQHFWSLWKVLGAICITVGGYGMKGNQGPELVDPRLILKGLRSDLIFGRKVLTVCDFHITRLYRIQS